MKAQKKPLTGALIAIATFTILIGIYFIIKNGKIGVGDTVFAEWTPGTWYPGIIDNTCTAGFHVKYTDGDEKCLAGTQIIKDSKPSKVSIGDKVIAQWTGAAYYSGQVIDKSNSTYKVKYYDNVEYDVSIDHIRPDRRGTK